MRLCHRSAWLALVFALGCQFSFPEPKPALDTLGQTAGTSGEPTLPIADASVRSDAAAPGGDASTGSTAKADATVDAADAAVYDDEDASVYVEPTYEELCANRCQRSKTERSCGVLHDSYCGDVDCGGCLDSEICAPLGDRSVCTACNDGDAAIRVGSAEVIDHAGALALRGVREVTGDLIVHADPALLGRLACLERVGGSLTLSHPNWNPTDLKGLSRLQQVEGDVTIQGSIQSEYDASIYYHLRSLEGLESLTSVGGRLTLDGGEYADLTGLQHLNSVGGDLVLSFTALESLSHLSGLTRIDGYLRISGGKFTTLEGLEQLAGVKGLEIKHAYRLLALRGLPALTQLDSVHLMELFSLLSLDGLEHLEHVKQDVVVQGTDLRDLHGLSKLAGVGGSLSLLFNYALETLDGLDALAAVGGDVTIASASGLASLDGLDALDSIGGGLSLETLGVRDVDALSALAHLGGTLALVDLPELESLAEPWALRELQGSLALVHCPMLSSIAGLTGLSAVEGALNLSGLSTLTDLTGLDELSSVGGDLELSSLEEVSSLQPLAKLASIGGTLVVFNNAKLPLCEADALASRLQTACACPAWTAPFCTQSYHGPICYPASCICSDACNCTGNDNSVTECTSTYRSGDP